MTFIEMEMTMKKIFLLLVGVFMLTTLLGCETVKGIGKDIQNTGQNIGDVLSGKSGS